LTPQKKLTISGHSAAVYDISFDGELLYSCSADKFVTRWHPETGDQDGFAVKCTSAPYSLSVDSSTGLLWIGLSSGDLHIIDTKEKKEVKFFQQHKVAIFSIIHLSKKSFSIVSDADGNLSIWNKNLKLELLMPLDCGKIRHMSCDENQDLLFVHGQDGNIRIIETKGFNEISTIQAHIGGACCSVLISENDGRMVSGGKDALLKSWSWKEEKSLEVIPAHNFAIYDLVHLEKANILVSASRDKSLKIWQADSLEFLSKIDLKNGGHKHSVNRIIQLGDRSFASCSDDSKIIRWEIP
jgi:WD40 repeat protein